MRQAFLQFDMGWGRPLCGRKQRPRIDPWMKLELQALSLQWVSNVFAQLVKLPVEYFQKRHLGDIVSRPRWSLHLKTAGSMAVFGRRQRS